MPYVFVIFDPSKVSQDTVDKFKPWLQLETAKALSSVTTLPSGCENENIETKPEEIFVGQYAAHPTDVNVSPFEVFIQAGCAKMRSGDKVQEILGKAISDTGWLPDEYLGQGQSCVFVVFNEFNGFGFIPRRH